MPVISSIEFTRSGRFLTARVSLEDENFVFLGNKLRSVDIHVYRCHPRGTYPHVTRIRERRLELFIGVRPNHVRDLEQNPTAAFEIVNNVECEGREGKFDRWIVKSPTWIRFASVDANEPSDDLVVAG